MLNGIGGYADRPDLLERALQLNLPKIPRSERKPERFIDRELEKLLPHYLGFLYDCVAFGLANLDEVDDTNSITMANAMNWLETLEPATGQFKSLMERVES